MRVPAMVVYGVIGSVSVVGAAFPVVFGLGVAALVGALIPVMMLSGIHPIRGWVLFGHVVDDGDDPEPPTPPRYGI